VKVQCQVRWNFQNDVKICSRQYMEVALLGLFIGSLCGFFPNRMIAQRTDQIHETFARNDAAPMGSGLGMHCWRFLS
jgi:hypothetical protein